MVPRDAAPEVLVLAPLAGDGPALARQVEAAGLPACVCADSDAFAEALRSRGPEDILLALVAHEGADARTGEALGRAQAAEPVWSRLPVLFLVSPRRGPPPACRMLETAAKAPPFAVLERPVPRPVLLKLLNVLADGRRRQYEVRDLLERLGASERRQTFLLRELRHRLGNSLGVLQAMFRLTARDASDLRSLVERFSQRLENFANAHAALSHEEGSARPLEALLGEHVEPYRSGASELRLDGPPVSLDSKLAFELALVLHELATNAAKYGAFSTGAGTVEVRWRPDPATGALDMVWTESGGPEVGTPSRQGLGSALIGNFAAAGARASLEFPSTGLVWRVRLPAETFRMDEPDPAA